MFVSTDKMFQLDKGLLVVLINQMLLLDKGFELEFTY